ncbi:hypothetical protein KC332_g7557 [Hortaea werneckii]|nr:hypothetical protein KC358_g7233 [Hortaea werneckii]KAI6830768.1 hypothetical protein KC350_g7494 [Hortaea werneckii]KAI6933932.1 hypothetical protein KC341_g7953 [Hortaea werneckii]KAI6962296.1 hypothetical protein KC321_g11837 [Hortaea werneckii]KAI6980619.1 hypothetical protein KC329_g9574 [Hortaea werneckii]
MASGSTNTDNVGLGITGLNEPVIENTHDTNSSNAQQYVRERDHSSTDEESREVGEASVEHDSTFLEATSRMNEDQVTNPDPVDSLSSLQTSVRQSRDPDLSSRFSDSSDEDDDTNENATTEPSWGIEELVRVQEESERENYYPDRPKSPVLGYPDERDGDIVKFRSNLYHGKSGPVELRQVRPNINAPSVGKSRLNKVRSAAEESPETSPIHDQAIVDPGLAAGVSGGYRTDESADHKHEDSDPDVQAPALYKSTSGQSWDEEDEDEDQKAIAASLQSLARDTDEKKRRKSLSMSDVPVDLEMDDAESGDGISGPEVIEHYLSEDFESHSEDSAAETNKPAPQLTGSLDDAAQDPDMSSPTSVSSFESTTGMRQSEGLEASTEYERSAKGNLAKQRALLYFQVAEENGNQREAEHIKRLLADKDHVEVLTSKVHLYRDDMERYRQQRNQIRERAEWLEQQLEKVHDEKDTILGKFMDARNSAAQWKAQAEYFRAFGEANDGLAERERRRQELAREYVKTVPLSSKNEFADDSNSAQTDTDDLLQVSPDSSAADRKVRQLAEEHERSIKTTDVGTQTEEGLQSLLQNSQSEQMTKMDGELKLQQQMHVDMLKLVHQYIETLKAKCEDTANENASLKALNSSLQLADRQSHSSGVSSPRHPRLAQLTQDPDSLSKELSPPTLAPKSPGRILSPVGLRDITSTSPPSPAAKRWQQPDSETGRPAAWINREAQIKNSEAYQRALAARREKRQVERQKEDEKLALRQKAYSKLCGWPEGVVPSMTPENKIRRLKILAEVVEL